MKTLLKPRKKLAMVVSFLAIVLVKFGENIHAVLNYVRIIRI